MDFLKNNKRFSFMLGDTFAWDLPYTVEVTEAENTLTAVYAFPGGIRVTNIAKKYEKFGAYEWVNILENTGDLPSDIISALWDCDCALPLKHEENKENRAYRPDPETATKIYSPGGSDHTQLEFSCDMDTTTNGDKAGRIYPGETREYCPFGGRSSHGKAPFFNIHKEGAGYIVAIGWTGQWHCTITRTNDSVQVRSKVEDTFFRLMPGEKIRTSSVVIMPYQSDVTDAQNKWRRLVKEEFSLIGQPGRDSHGPLCASIWGGMKSRSVLDRIETIKKYQLPYEYVWMDAGWYGETTAPTPDEFEGDWWDHTGDWRVSPLVHPEGLTDVTRAVHEAGMKLLLWFEPERVIRTTPTAICHPEWFLTGEFYDNSRLLNLGDPEAWNYCFETLSALIEKLHIDCYRQDFNTCPLVFWQKNDAADRKGITEIKHISGLYRLWDALLERFPHLIIDNCASGGRRIDIETLRRSIPLWRSDFQCPANYEESGAQCHNPGFAAWMPFSGTGSGRSYDEYRMRSAYAPALTVNHSFSEREAFADTPEKAAFLKKSLEEYVRVRPYFSGDFYPLTEVSTKTDVWCAMQYDRPEEKDGMVQVFRRENSPYETACFALRGLDAAAEYLFTDPDGGAFTVSGKELAEQGLRLTVPEKRKAKIYFYRAK